MSAMATDDDHSAPIRCRRPLAFVAGASGYTGRALVAALRREGLATVAHLRPGSSTGDALAEQFRRLGAAVDRSPWQPEAMANALRERGPTAVYALLGTTRARARVDGMGYEAVDYGLSSMLYRASRESSPHRTEDLPRFIYLSSMGAERPGASAYLRARHRMEAEIRDGPLAHVIVRPAFISGDDRPEARPLERWAARGVDRALAMAARVGFSEWPNTYGSLDGPTLAEALASLCYEEQHLGKILGVGDLRRLGNERRAKFTR